MFLNKGGNYLADENLKMHEYLQLLYSDKYESEFIKIATRHPIIGNFAYNYFDTVEDAEKYIDLNRGKFDVYAGLATTIDRSGKEELIGSRNCLAFDFDIKDYEGNLSHKDILEKFKSIGLYYHLMIDSGHGFHVYVFTERTKDIERITSLNKKIAEQLNADIKGTLKTQILRVPQTFNYKEKLYKNVSTIFTAKKIRYYSLDELERRFKNKFSTEDTIIRKLDKLKSDMYCVMEMLKGVPEGHRNTALGRIVKYYQVRGYSKANVKEIIREWNSRCSPPKKFSEVERDFNSYWEKDYNLLGCTLTDSRLQSIISKYCDKYKCGYCSKGDYAVLAEREFLVDNHYLEERTMRKLNGYDYLVLSLLIANVGGLNTNQVQEKLTPRKGFKCCISKPKLYQVLKNLVKEGFIDCTESKRMNEPNFYKVKNRNNFGKGYTRLLYSSSNLFINKNITQNEYLVYIFLAKRLQQCKSVTYDDIANALNMDKPNISRYIKGLEDAGLLQVRKQYNEKGFLCNKYILMA